MTDGTDVSGGQMAKRRTFLNPPPRDIPEGAPTDAVKAEFGRRIQHRMQEKGWNQSELARAAAKFMPDKKFRRDNVSVYVRGIALPGPVRLNAIAKALGCKPMDLLPAHSIATAESAAPTFNVQALPESGRVWLRVNAAVSMETALKVMELLRGEGVTS